MPEQITQKLGFDASAAITSLTNLNQKLREFRQGLQATAGGLRKFEKNATTAVATFNTLGKSAILAAASVNQLRIASGGVVPPQVASQAAAASAAMGTLGASAVIAKAKLGGLSASATTSSAAMAKVATSATAAAAAAQAGSATTVAAANRTAAALAKTGKAGEKAGKSILVSWKTIGRIILAQAVIRGLSMLVSTFNDAQEAAREFSLRVGEISTIAGGALGSIDSISESTLELSRALGLATSEVAEGLYQTLSNQVVDVADAMRFETTAARLSITTHSQLKESINALSSVMNSYGLDISEVDEVSAVLFKTIELGRLRMGEFGDVLGRVTPLTAALGIEYKEMAASLAALTQKGVPAHTAITQLTAVTQKLLRPTEKLKELYHEWGVETGPEAIRRFGGLRGVLLKMKDATAGNDAEFAALLGRVRSMVGAMNLTTDGADSLTRALKAMDDPTEDLTTALARMESTIGRRSVRAWDDLDVSITQAGKTFLEITTPMVEILASMARNVDSVVAVMAALATGMLVVSTNMAAAGAAFLGLNFKAIVLRTTLMTLWPVVVAVAAALAAMQVKKAFLDWLDTASELVAEQAVKEEAWAKAVEEASVRRIKATKKEVKERTKLIGEFLTRESKAIERGVAGFAIKSSSIGSVLEDTLTRLQGVRVSSLKAVEAAVLDMDGAIENSKNVVAALDKTLDDLAHARKTRNLSELGKLNADFTRADQQAREASAAFSDAQASTERRDAARKLAAIAQASAKQNLQAALSLGNQGKISQAEEKYTKVLKEQQDGELKWIETRERLHTKQNVTDLKRAKELSATLAELNEEQARLASDFDDGKKKTPLQFEADQKSLEALGPQIQETIEEYLEAIKFADSLKLDGLGAKTILEVQDGISAARFDWANAVVSLREQLAAESFSVKLALDVTDKDFRKQFETRQGEFDSTDPKNLDKNIQVSQDILKEQADAVATLDASYRSLALAMDGIEGITLDPAAWNNFTDVAKDLWEEGKLAAKFAEDGFGEASASMAKMAVPSTMILESWKTVDGILRKVTAEKRALTTEELKTLNAIIEYNAAQQEAGVLSGNRLALALEMNRLLKAFVATQQESIEAEKVLEDLGTSPAQATKVLKATEEGAKRSNEEVAELNKEAARTTSTVKLLPPEIAKGTAALTTEKEAAKGVKTVIDGTVLSQKRLNELKAQYNIQSPTQPQKTPEPIESPVKVEDFKEATEAAKPLADELGKISDATEDVSSAFGTKIVEGVALAAPSVGLLGVAVVTLAGKVGDVTTEVGGVTTAVGTTSDTVVIATENTGVWSTAMAGLVTVAMQVTAAMQEAERASKRAGQAAMLAAAAGGGGGGTAFHGGPAANYMAAGGPTSRGRDTIPVMTAPGEFITNARNSRRFASQLQAMNAGKEPIFRDKGGSVTNVGDVNVSVTSGETASQTARQIATSLRRELRRGTSRL